LPYSQLFRLVKAPDDGVCDSNLWRSRPLARTDGVLSSRHSYNRKRKAIKADTCLRYPSGSNDLCGDSSTAASLGNLGPNANWDLQSSSLDNDLSDDVSRRQCAEEFEFRSGRTAFCRICQLHVKSTSDKYVTCDVQYTDALFVMSLQRITFRTFEFILRNCFGDHQIFRRQDPDVVACLTDMLNCVSNGSTACMTMTDFCSRSDGQEERVPLAAAGSIFSEPPAILARTHSRNTCRLCFESNVKHLERHVLQHHIKQPMFLCPCCNFSSCYSPTSVKDHIKTRHSMYDPVPLDVRDEYAEIIQTVYNQCFVDDSAVLASRIAFKQHLLPIEDTIGDMKRRLLNYGNLPKDLLAKRKLKKKC
ncbi:hypothetical protein COOONC_26537, partial [Cooperia oncophora]